MAQVLLLGPMVGSCLALFCIYRVDRVNSRNVSFLSHDDSTINIVLVIIIIIIIIILSAHMIMGELNKMTDRLIESRYSA